MIVAQYFEAFILFSFIGWIYECIYCTVKDGHWDNRGFLFGPVCPIYGSSVVLAMIVFGHLPLFQDGFYAPVWQVFISCALISAVAEYLTSYVLERLFHAVWWDYSSMPFNINGRICLPATCGFGVAGVFIVRYLLPFIFSLPADQHPLVNETVALLFMLVFGIDIAVTVVSLSDMLERLENMQAEFDRRMQTGYELVKDISRKDSHHLKSIRGFKSEKTSSIASRIRLAMAERKAANKRAKCD